MCLRGRWIWIKSNSKLLDLPNTWFVQILEFQMKSLFPNTPWGYSPGISRKKQHWGINNKRIYHTFTITENLGKADIPGLTHMILQDKVAVKMCDSRALSFVKKNCQFTHLQILPWSWRWQSTDNYYIEEQTNIKIRNTKDQRMIYEKIHKCLRN